MGVKTSYLRPAELAEDNTPKIKAIKHVTEYTEKLKNISIDIIVDLDIGVPLRSPEDIDTAIEKMIADKDMQCLVTVYPSQRNPYFNMVRKYDKYYNLVNIPDTPVFSRQTAPEVFSITPAVFAWKRDAMHISHLYTGNWGIHEMPVERSIDIDSPFDFKIASLLIKEQS